MNPSCIYTANNSVCVSYPFLLGNSFCLCPVDNWFYEWQCCITEPLLSLDNPLVNSTVIDCWCRAQPTPGGWVTIMILSVAFLIQLAVSYVLELKLEKKATNSNHHQRETQTRNTDINSGEEQSSQLNEQSEIVGDQHRSHEFGVEEKEKSSESIPKARKFVSFKVTDKV
uniref:Uncharacterized protein n=1 Tax=Timspurckia oligopyrenoides TaxID=708627 RepID=A0A6T6MPV9_9RHOD|mmetsp:Transcript_4298/g.7543  ORF Transcript_4298/g.7543 Transcript_4298/m.7543 type:complete len:170 (+) Transcript_4298:79-588(+)